MWKKCSRSRRQPSHVKKFEMDVKAKNWPRKTINLVWERAKANPYLIYTKYDLAQMTKEKWSPPIPKNVWEKFVQKLEMLELKQEDQINIKWIIYLDINQLNGPRNGDRIILHYLIQNSVLNKEAQLFVKTLFEKSPKLFDEKYDIYELATKRFKKTANPTKKRFMNEKWNALVEDSSFLIIGPEKNEELILLQSQWEQEWNSTKVKTHCQKVASRGRLKYSHEDIKRISSSI